MRVVVQRVSEASVRIEGKIKAEIAQGLLILLGITDEDTEEDISWLCGKIARMRIFNDQEGVMNHSLLQVNGNALVISQFTLYASTRKGNRPSYIKAARPEVAIPLYEKFLLNLEKELGKEIGSGEFGADMQVGMINDGPVTILVDSRDRS